MVASFLAIDSATRQRLEQNPSLVQAYLYPEDGEWPEGVYIDKAWHGIHYLLTGRAWGGDGPLALAVMGGKEIGTSGDFSPRLLSEAQVQEITTALSGIDAETFAKRFDAKAMTKADIYPDRIWERDGKDALDYVVHYFNDMVAFYREAAERGDAAILKLG